MISQGVFLAAIPRRASACCGCSHAFAPGDLLFSALSTKEMGEEEIAERRDLCPACWEKEEPALTGAWCQWKGAVPQKHQETAVPLSEEEKTLALLKERLQSDQIEEKRAAYVLVIYLERRGILRRCKEMRSEVPDSDLYEVGATGECLHIPKVELAMLAQNTLKEELISQLKKK